MDSVTSNILLDFDRWSCCCCLPWLPSPSLPLTTPLPHLILSSLIVSDVAPINALLKYLWNFAFQENNHLKERCWLGLVLPSTDKLTLPDSQFPPICLVIIILPLKISSKVQRSRLKFWDWQIYFSSFSNPGCWTVPFAGCMVSPLCAEWKKALCSVCFHTALPGPQSTQAQHCECTNQLELLIHSTQLVSFPRDEISVLINNLGTEVFFSFLLRLWTPWSQPHSYWPEVALLIPFLIFFIPQIAKEYYAVCFNLLCKV